MKRDGLTPYASREPDIVEGELRGALASAVGMDNYDYDYEHGMSPNTVAIRAHSGEVSAACVRAEALHDANQSAADGTPIRGAQFGRAGQWQFRARRSARRGWRVCA